MLLPANALEQALHNAAADENKVEEFYRLMMQSRVFILGKPVKEVANADFVLTDDDEVLINHWESEEDKSPVIPFFTSLQTLQRTIPENEAYLEVPTEALFRMTLGVPMVLNPNTEYGMEFSPEDVVSLLGSDSVNHLQELLDDGEYDEDGVYLELLHGKPDVLTDTMATIMADYPEIEAAYLAVIHEPSADPEPHLLIGIQGHGDLDAVIESVAERIPEDNNDSDFETFDFFTMGERDPEVTAFLLEQVQPFYSTTSTQTH
ncbi:MAG: hypothetical protein CSB47_11255 [Proteobacteria bacterium]|nr:MAG: hypothetical protein CSB47_11255 [Pseudomonadota bacterium]